VVDPATSASISTTDTEHVTRTLTSLTDEDVEHLADSLATAWHRSTLWLAITVALPVASCTSSFNP
jgi:hypothetical protein